MNISSLVIKTKPEHVEEVKERLKESGLCELHFADDLGRIVVTIEGENSKDEMNKVKRIQEIPNVLNAELSYSYSEEEFADASKEFEKIKDPVPDALKDDN